MISPQPVIFGALLRRYRTAAGLSQEELAERAGLSVDAISTHERGRRRPYRDTVQRLADALALRPQDRAAFVAAARGPGVLASSRAYTPPTAAQDDYPVDRPDSAHRAPVLAEGPSHHPVGAGATVGARAPLIGRGRERAVLDLHLGQSGGEAGVAVGSWSEPPLLILAGEPGIGKTRLLQEAIERAPGYGWTVLQGGCQRQSDMVPFGDPYAPLLGALERHIHQGNSAARAGDLEGCAWLVRLLPELAEHGLAPIPAGLMAPAQERRLMFGAVSRYLANVAGPSGTLLVLDDLQWAGADVCALLTTLVHASAPRLAPTSGLSGHHASPLRLIAAYRDTETRPGDALSSMVTDLAQAGLAVRHTLVPLTVGETRQLLDLLAARGGQGDGLIAEAEEDRALRERVVARTGGVPFFVVRYAQDLAAAPQAADGHGGEGVPWDVAQSIRHRVKALPPPAQEVLGAAAVIGRVIPPALLTAVAAHAEHETLAALAAICAAGLLVEDGTTYRFAHDVIREVVEADVGLAPRLALHRRVAAALEDMPGAAPVEQLAYHYSHSTTPHRAVAYLERAGDGALQRAAYAAAEGYYRELVERLDALGRVEEAAGARVKLGGTLRAAARYDAALPILEQAAAAYRAHGSLEQLAQVTVQSALVYGDKGQPGIGLERLQALLQSVAARGPSLALAVLHIAQGHLLFFSGRIEEALAATERVMDLARAVGAEGLLAPAELARGNALRMLGRVAEALPVMEDAVRRAEAVGDQSSLIGALDNLAWVSLARGELDVAAAHNARALTLAERLGHPLAFVTMTCARGALAFLRGDWTQARADLDRAVATGREIGEGRGVMYSLAELGRLCLATGEWETAARTLEECRSMAERSGDLHGLRAAQGALAELDLREGRPAAAHERLVPLLDRPGLQEWAVTELLPVLAWAYLELGEADRAADVGMQAMERARVQTNRVALIDALRVHGLVLLRQRRWADGASVLAEALTLARALGIPYAEARVLQACGALSAARGEPDPAWERWEAARVIFAQLGASRDTEIIARAIAALDRPA
jgi:tetratricopeptide (TPR) repeat protein/transcriptional regulator with XRE-family HTH domain